MTNYPMRWFANIARLLEKREYSVYRIFLFSLFVGSVRLFSEWAMGGVYPRIPLSALVLVAGFYWFSFFVFTAVLAILVDQPWRVSINVILVGVFLGIFPPILDLMISGTGFQYGYVWNAGDWKWMIYNPEHHITPGEAIVLWAVIVFTALYVAHKTRSAARTLGAIALAYGAVFLIATVLADLAERIRHHLDWPGDHRVVTLGLLQVIATLVLYLALQPRLRKGLARRVPHALPFVLFCFLGSAIFDTVSVTTWIYGFIVFLAGLVALGQNDYFDAVEDTSQGREGYLDLEDVRFLTITGVCGIVVLAAGNATVIFPAVTALAAMSLYNFPFYRGKKYFPSNLKIEGVWGFTAFAFGIVAAVEHAAFAGPRWWASGVPVPRNPEALQAFDGVTIIAMLLAFGGFTLVAALKDYKDMEADHAAGVQTLYTLAVRRNWNLKRVHFTVITVSAVAIALAPVLLAGAGKIPGFLMAGGPIAGAMLWLQMSGPPSPRDFRRALITLTLYFLFLIVGLEVF